MLIMFKVKNFTSFKDEAKLDMRATAYKQHPSHLLTTPEGKKLIKTAAIYGANASGKSNFISAMYFFENYIFDQFISKSDSASQGLVEDVITSKFEAYQLTDNITKASEFEIIFTYNGKTFQYGFECTSEEVINEWYYIDDYKVYERNGDHVDIGSKYGKYIKDFKKTPKKRLYLSVLEYFLDEKEKNIILSDFIAFFRTEYDVFLELFFDSTVKQIANLIRINKRLVKNKTFREKVESYLKQVDVGIKGLKVVEENVVNDRTGKSEKRKTLRTIHDVYDIDGNICGQKDFELSKESTGTLRFLSYIQEVVEMTERGGVFVVDEISARLHPLLTKLIIDIFQSSNNTKAQFIFTTHDVSLLNKDQFRRDEVVFVDKNSKGESSLYSLSDLKVRDDASFNKDYLQGKYGAIPIFDYDILLDGDKIG
ncbi:MAG: ATP-binding protein [Eubacteriales bacterium]|nr:ATP-binding protein [Eubacteriales bacterium]MDD3503955.1 ATP-binding protein [Eubacteriales bacterium]MDD4683063.1 ATP-binding protein [Eubacteriales bacterium]